MTDLRGSWDAEADNWVRFARTPGHDVYFWDMSLGILLELLPPPGRLTVDVGCGEGRLARTLRAQGHTVVGLDSSRAMVRHAMEAEPGRYVAADAARVPLRSECADLVIAFMTLHDFDDVDAAVAEISRVLEPGGRFCLAIVHPMNSARDLDHDADDPGVPLVIPGSYLQESRTRFDSVRGDIACTFHSMHRPLEAYTGALERAGLLIETLREPPISFDGRRRASVRAVPPALPALSVCAGREALSPTPATRG